MPLFLRALRLLSLVLWVGGIAFFAFVVAPVAFHSLPSPHEAGMVVRGSLIVLHWMGIVCGVVFLGAAAGLRGRTLPVWQIVLAGGMLTLTVVSQERVLPAMEADRAAGGGIIETLGTDDPRRVDFERLHVLSERLEGAVLLAGLALVVMVAAEDRATGR